MERAIYTGPVGRILPLEWFHDSPITIVVQPSDPVAQVVAAAPVPLAHSAAVMETLNRFTLQPDSSLADQQARAFLRSTSELHRWLPKPRPVMHPRALRAI